MNKLLSNIKITHKVLLPVISFLVGYATFGIISFQTLKTVQVKGPLYNNIVQGKDLIADILPPPEYLIEAYLVCHQMTMERDPKAMSLLIEKGQQLKKDYIVRHEYWSKDLPESQMKQTLLQSSYDPAMKFFSLRDSEFIPAIQKGNWSLASSLLNGPIKQQYLLHRESIDKVVVLATERNALDESTALSVIATRTHLMFVVALLVTIVSVITGVSVAKNLTRRIKLICKVAERIAVGDVSAI